MPLLDVVGRAVILLPAQNSFTNVNEGIVAELMIMVVVTLVAHCPAFGVNVYVLVAWLLIAGDHDP